MSVLPPQHQRVGAHRARRNPVAATATAATAAVALTALLLWGLSATGIIGGSGESAVADGSGAGAGVDPSVPATDGMAAEPTTQPSMAPSAPMSPSPSPSPSTPVVDQAATIAVLNGGKNVPGIASGTVEQLTAAGWTGIDPALTGNTPDFPGVATTIVYFADPAQQATAEALVGALGAGTAQQGDFAANGWTTQLVVVMGADFPDPSA
ncbi:MAG: LytR C-terminal domain-containing protein [Kineosporiaceae bacterium]